VYSREIDGLPRPLSDPQSQPNSLTYDRREWLEICKCQLQPQIDPLGIVIALSNDEDRGITADVYRRLIVTARGGIKMWNLGAGGLEWETVIRNYLTWSGRKNERKNKGLMQ
jgi:hypothetical protein